MNTQSLILSILNFGDASGYEIKKQSSEGAFSFFVDISYGTIYPTLARLETEGLVTSRSEAQSGKPDKKVYSITELGRAEFIRMLDVIPQRDKFKSEFLLVSMCAGLCSKETIENAIDKQIGDTQEVLQIIEDMREQCEGDAASMWVTDYGIHVKKAALEYLTKNRQSLLDMAGGELQRKDAAE
ncbi:MAG: PadR family transcriptional regulator [Pseudomonadota bacterium]